MKIQTLTGLDMEQASGLMQTVLPDEAYKPLPGAADLTDINPAFLWEVLTECFGLAGYGWFYKKGALVTEIVSEGTRKDGWIRATFDDFTLFYRLVVDDEIILADGIESNGASENADFSYAVRGATTNALGGAARMLLWQLHIYKGQKQARNSHKQPPPRNDGKPGDMVINFAPRDKPELKGKTIAELWQIDPGWVEYLGREGRQPPIKMAAAAYAKAQAAPAEPKHWIDDDNVRRRFWAFAGTIGLDDEAVHAALNVEHIADFAGTMEQAKVAMEAWAKNLPAPVEDDEPF